MRAVRKRLIESTLRPKPGGALSLRSAFTLIELVTVVAILGIMALAIGGPTMSYVDVIRSRAAASRLAGDIRYAQRVALNSGLLTWVVFSTTGNNYKLFVEDPNNPGKAGRLSLAHPLDPTTNTVQFGSGPFTNVAISSVNINSTNEVEFDSSGVPYDGNENQLTTAGTINLNSGVTITIHPVGGFAERTG